MAPSVAIVCNCRKNHRSMLSRVPLVKPGWLDFNNTHTVLRGAGQIRDSVAKNIAQSDGA